MKIIRDLKGSRAHDCAVTYIHDMIFGKNGGSFTDKQLYLLWGLLPPGDLVLFDEAFNECLIQVTDDAISIDYDYKGDVPGAAVLNFYRPEFLISKECSYNERGFVFPYKKGGVNAKEENQ